VENRLEAGMSYTSEKVVTQKDMACEYGSGGLEVFATPAMIGLMENAAMSVVQPCLDEGSSTVGTMVNIKHIAATPVGMKVKATAELLEISGKRLLFKVQAFDEKGLIGEGTHERYIINIQKFLSRLA
jgi:predicted thioesterase